MEARLRHARSALYQRLAIGHAGPLGLALLGYPELAPRYPEAYGACQGAPGLACQGVGGIPKVCLASRLAHLARSALRGGERRRAQEKAMVQDLLTCMAHLEAIVPEALKPPLTETAQKLRWDLAYLEGTLPPEAYLERLTRAARGETPR